MRGDDYGEFINLEDFDVSGLKEENKENIDLQIPYDDDDMMGEDWLRTFVFLQVIHSKHTRSTVFLLIYLLIYLFS